MIFMSSREMLALYQHIQALETMLESYKREKKILEETLKKLEELGPERRYYLNLGAMLAESSYEEAKKTIEEQISILEARIAKVQKQIDELKTKIRA